MPSGSLNLKKDAAMADIQPPKQNFFDRLLDFLMCIEPRSANTTLDNAVDVSQTFVSENELGPRALLPKRPSVILTKPEKETVKNFVNKTDKKKMKTDVTRSKPSVSKTTRSEPSNSQGTRSAPARSQDKQMAKPKGSFIRKMANKIDQKVKQSKTETVRVPPGIAQILADHPSLMSMDDLRALARTM